MTKLPDGRKICEKINQSIEIKEGRNEDKNQPSPSKKVALLGKDAAASFTRVNFSIQFSFIKIQGDSIENFVLTDFQPRKKRFGCIH